MPSMKTWITSKKYLDQTHKTRIWATIIATAVVWAPLAYLAITLARTGMHADGAILIGLGLPSLVILVPMPLWMWLVMTKTLHRVSDTTVSLTTDPDQARINKSVEGESFAIPINTLSEIRLMRGPDGHLRRIRLVRLAGEPVDLDNLEDPNGFLAALREMVPICPIKEWTMPRRLKAIGLAAVAVLVCLGAVAMLGKINQIVFICVCWFIVLLAWFGFRSYHPVSYRWDAYRLSSQLGEKYLWLDFAFAGLVFFLWAAAIVQGWHVVHEGRLTDLLRISFVPIVVGVPFLFSFIKHVDQMPPKRKAVSVAILVALLGANVWFGIREHQKFRGTEAREKWQVLLDQQRYAEAIPLLEEAYRQNPHERLYAERLGYAYAAVGRYQDANAILNSLQPSAGYPQELLAYNNKALAASYIQTHDWGKALGAARVVIAIKPGDAEAYHLAGLAAWQLEGPKSKTAHDYYARYMQLEPDPAKTAFIKPLYPDLFRKSK